MNGYVLSSKEFNSEWLCHVTWQELDTLLGYSSLKTLLDDCFEKVMRKLSVSDREKLVLRPFHGSVITFYRR